MTIYFDNAATTHPKPEAVYLAMDRFARNSMANPGRAGHRMALAAERTLDQTRHLLHLFFAGKSPDRWIFTLNCTDALNIAIKGTVCDGDHIITSSLEHNSISRPLRAMEIAGRISVTRLEPDAHGTLRLEELERAFRPNTRLVALTHASNVLGTVQPIAEAAWITRSHDALFLLDAAQTAGVLPISVEAGHIDLLATAGHKGLMGPAGTGVLYAGPRTRLRPWREGGTGGDSASETQPLELPFLLEGGTPNVVGVEGLGAGIRWIQERSIEQIHHGESLLAERLSMALEEIPGVELFGHRDWSRRVATIPFRLEMLDATEVGGILDQAFDIAVRPGLHCAPFIHRSLGSFPVGLVRASIGPFNTEAEVDTLAAAMREIAG
ncbi:MAG: aminotransferase class V-fold PLP-dependent enzyme [Planctomycetota bacterium]|nr:aminotransferase class V-fold PLP-dependent enzyme [Planctomycetota bacterium]